MPIEAMADGVPQLSGQPATLCGGPTGPQPELVPEPECGYATTPKFQPQPAMVADAARAQRVASLAEATSTPDDEDTARLQPLFMATEALIQKIRDGRRPSNDPDVQTTVQHCLGLLQRCSAAVTAAGILSSNEEADDIKTGDLKLLLLPHYTAEMLLRQATPGGATERLPLLEAAAKEWGVFIAQCKQKGLVPPEDLAVLHREEGARIDPAAQRSEKIARLKREKAEVERERQMTMRRRALQREIGEGDEALLEDNGELEEVERELFSLQVGKGLREAIDQLAMTKQERDMLRMVLGPMGGHQAALEAEKKQRLARDQQRQEGPKSFTINKRAQDMAMQLDSTSSLGLGNRAVQQAAMAQQVYAPKVGYTMLPTEWAEGEMDQIAKDQIAQAEAKHNYEVEKNTTYAAWTIRCPLRFGLSRAKGSHVLVLCMCCACVVVLFFCQHRFGASHGFERVPGGFKEAQPHDEDDLRFEDEKTLKDRAWDNWKDENRPNGNTLKNSSGVSC